MIKHCLGNSQINLIPAWSKDFSYITFLYRKNVRFYAYNQRKQLLFTHMAKLKKFATLKTHLSINWEHKSTVEESWFLIPCHRCEKSARESSNSQYLIPQRDNIHARTTTRAWIYDVRMAQSVLKIEKLSHIMGPRGSQDLRSPSPIMAPGYLCN